MLIHWKVIILISCPLIDINPPKWVYCRPMTTLPQLCPSRQASARWDCRDWAGHRASQRLRPAGNEGNGKSQRSGGVAVSFLKWGVPQLYMWIFHVYSIAMFAKAMENDNTLPWPRPPFGAAEKILNLQLHEHISQSIVVHHVRSQQSRTTSHETGLCWQMTCKGHKTSNCLGRFVGLSWSTSQVVVFHVGALSQVEIPDQANSKKLRGFQKLAA